MFISLFINTKIARVTQFTSFWPWQSIHVGCIYWVVTCLTLPTGVSDCVEVTELPPLLRISNSFVNDFIHSRGDRRCLGGGSFTFDRGFMFSAHYNVLGLNFPVFRGDMSPYDYENCQRSVCMGVCIYIASLYMYICSCRPPRAMPCT